MLSLNVHNLNVFATSISLVRVLPQKVSRICGAVINFFKKASSLSDKESFKKDHRIVIIGSGPAGYTAAIYAARANLHPIVYEGAFGDTSNPGGQLMTTTKVENYPGFPNGIDGPDLIANLRQQALNFGATMLEEDVVEADLTKYPFTIRGQLTTNQADAVIIATGAKANRPSIPGTGDGELWQRGVSACAVCDGALPAFRNRPVFVIGGGDSAMEEALFLSKFASKVFVVHRRDQLRASKIMQKAVFANPKIEIIWNSVMMRVNGEQAVQSVMIQNVKTMQEKVHEAAGVFFAIGHTPNAAFLKGQLELDSNGYIRVKQGTSQTSIPYVFAAGDVQDPIYRQAITAAGSGCISALDAERALAVREEVKR
jgi:thioredoxin reductase (NADPH)